MDDTARNRIVIVAAVILSFIGVSSRADTKTGKEKKPKVWVAVFDFKTVGNVKTNAQVLKEKTYGYQLADSIRLKLRRRGERWHVIDRFTASDAADSVGSDAKPGRIRKIMAEQIGANLAIYGDVSKNGDTVKADVSCIDMRSGQPGTIWRQVFTDDTERARGLIARGVVEKIVGRELWRPPEYGDEPEPSLKKLGTPVNGNGGFESGWKGWDPPDNASTFLEKGPPGHGTILRIKTNLNRDIWLAYRKALRKGQADPGNPPNITEDSSYGSVAGLEGVHYRSDFFKATPGGRYWLLADHRGKGGKVFIKGFRRTAHALDGLPESSLAERGLTPRQFAALPKAKRAALVAADAKKHPARYYRECYRWYLNCEGDPNEWTHHAAPVPPRGGLPDYVEVISIQIYSYWPPGEYRWDNVNLYPDPKQKTLLTEEKARTDNFGKTSDVVEKEYEKKTGEKKK